MTSECRQRRASFDVNAHLFHEARPGYPSALVDDVVSYSGIPRAGRILEVGCGTGIATLLFARRGYRMLCIELGEHLATVARHNLAVYPLVEVRVGAFEDVRVEPEAFDLLMSATAWHWIEQPAGYRKAAQALKSGGAIAIFRHVHVRSERDRGFFDAVQGIYDRVAPAIATSGFSLPTPDDVSARAEVEEINQTGLFGPVEVRRYVWDEEYDSASYLRLLNTYSDHLSLDVATRTGLFHGIESLINGPFDGRITKGYLAQLVMARRR